MTELEAEKIQQSFIEESENVNKVVSKQIIITSVNVLKDLSYMYGYLQAMRAKVPDSVYDEYRKNLYKKKKDIDKQIEMINEQITKL